MLVLVKLDIWVSTLYYKFTQVKCREKKKTFYHIYVAQYKNGTKYHFEGECVFPFINVPQLIVAFSVQQLRVSLESEKQEKSHMETLE